MNTFKKFCVRAVMLIFIAAGFTVASADAGERGIIHPSTVQHLHKLTIKSLVEEKLHDKGKVTCPKSIHPRIDVLPTCSYEFEVRLVGYDYVMTKLVVSHKKQSGDEVIERSLRILPSWQEKRKEGDTILLQDLTLSPDGDTHTHVSNSVTIDIPSVHVPEPVALPSNGGSKVWGTPDDIPPTITVPAPSITLLSRKILVSDSYRDDGIPYFTPLASERYAKHNFGIVSADHNVTGDMYAPEKYLSATHELTWRERVHRGTLESIGWCLLIAIPSAFILYFMQCVCKPMPRLPEAKAIGFFERRRRKLLYRLDRNAMKTATILPYHSVKNKSA